MPASTLTSPRPHRLVVRLVALLAVLLGLTAFAPAPARADIGFDPFPVAVPTASASYVQVGTSIDFDGSGSYGVEGAIISDWTWDFGDGTTASGARVSHAYTNPAMRVVTLTVTDQYGTARSAFLYITAWDYPTAIISASPGTVGPAPLTVDFSGAFSLGAGWPITSYEWSFGDGTTASGVMVSHTYATPGRYLASLSVRNELGWGGTVYQAIDATEVMAPPTDLAVTTPARRAAQLTWSTPMTSLVSIRVQRCQGRGCTGFTTIDYLPGDATSYTDSGLRCGRIYRYRLEVEGFTGETGLSNVASVRAR